MRSDVSKFNLEFYRDTPDELYKLLNAYSGVKTKDCAKVIQHLPEVVYDLMNVEKDCTIRGLCTFYVSKMSPKEGINFDGERVLFKEGLTVRCRIRDSFKAKFKREFRRQRKEIEMKG